MKNDDLNNIPKSFKTATIALIFLILGFQFAIFLHKGAVLSILSKRDAPDTVFVIENQIGNPTETPIEDTKTTTSKEKNLPKKKDQKRFVRHNAPHPKSVETIRKNFSSQEPQLFVFNPNNASKDDFIRLGLSESQSESIVSYRDKGHRFYVKEDFKRLYAINERIYSRLEKYIDLQPLDLNSADSAALDSLPGIGGYFARAIVKHRNELGGYSTKKQLLDIYHFDEEKLSKIEDKIIISKPAVFDLWHCSLEKLRLHPYIKNYHTAKAIILFRENSPKEKWTVDELEKNGIINKDQARKLKNCIFAPI